MTFTAEMGRPAVPDLGWRRALESLGLPDRLSAFDARVVGTWPLGIALPSSDIDIVAFAPRQEEFADALRAAFGGQEGFTVRERLGKPASLVASFWQGGFEWEIFGQDCPVEQQYGWRHFVAERRLLELGGLPMRRAVMFKRGLGLKTEPAFAAALGLAGDPYAVMAALCDVPDQTLRNMIHAAGIAC